MASGYPATGGAAGGGDRRFWPMGELARVLEVNPKTIRAMIAAGQVRAVRVGLQGQYRIPIDEVRRLLGDEGGGESKAAKK